MRALLAFALLLVGLPALADPYQRLYQAAGWPDQRAHFSDALDAAQKRYQDKLPPALYQTLVDNSIAASPRPKSTSAPSTACARTCRTAPAR